MPEMEKSFEDLKNQFTTAPILTHFDLRRTCIVDIDVSDFTLYAILSPPDDERRRNPLGFYSRKFQLAEINYKVHTKELLTIIDSFKVWHHYLEGALCNMKVYSAHQNVEYFTMTKILNRRQACWAQELAANDFKTIYYLGSKNGKPDGLSWHSEYHPENGGSEDQPIMTILSPKSFLHKKKK
jgi:hypothetical protein